MKNAALGITFCWHCGRKLMTRAGGGYSFVMVRAQDGGLHRIHRACVDDCVVDGVKLAHTLPAEANLSDEEIRAAALSGSPAVMAEAQARLYDELADKLASRPTDAWALNGVDVIGILSALRQAADWRRSASSHTASSVVSHPVFAFLLGEGPLDGFHFGDFDTSRPRPRFWWRAHLREALAELAVRPAAGQPASFRVIRRPLLVAGMLTEHGDIFIDSESPPSEQNVTLWHEALHKAGMTDETQVEAVARKLAEFSVAPTAPVTPSAWAVAQADVLREALEFYASGKHLTGYGAWFVVDGFPKSFLAPPHAQPDRRWLAEDGAKAKQALAAAPSAGAVNAGDEHVRGSLADFLTAAELAEQEDVDDSDIIAQRNRDFLRAAWAAIPAVRLAAAASASSVVNAILRDYVEKQANDFFRTTHDAGVVAAQDVLILIDKRHHGGISKGMYITCLNGHVIGMALRDVKFGDINWASAFGEWTQEDHPSPGSFRHPPCARCGAAFSRNFNSQWQLHFGDGVWR